MCCVVFCFFKQKTAYEMRISDWSSDVCSSDLPIQFICVTDEQQSSRSYGTTCQRGACLMKRYAYGWITALFFLVSIAAHWIFGWYAFVDEAREHGQLVEVGSYLVEMGRDTFENWRSEERRVGKECVSRCRSGWSK